MFSRVKRNDKIGFLFFFAFVLSTSLIWILEERFDKELWETRQMSRYKLADDIIKSKLLIGKTKSEVIDFLGAPNSEVNSNQELFLYKLGKPPSFFEPRMELLYVVFVNEKVIEVSQIQE